MNRLKSTGATNEMLETVITKGGNLEKTLKVGNSSKGVTWLEQGTTSTGWQHIFEKHVQTGEFRNIGIADSQVQQKIFDTVSNPQGGLLSSKSVTDMWCFFSSAIKVGLKTYYVKVVRGSNGYIITAYPTTDITCT